MILETVFFTVLSGVLVYAIGQIFSKFYIEPIHLQKETIGKIADALIFYQNLYLNLPNYNDDEDTKKRKEANLKFRTLAGELISRTHLIPSYKYLAFLNIVPKRKNISEAHYKLFGISNTVQNITLETITYNLNFKKELEESLDLITQ